MRYPVLPIQTNIGMNLTYNQLHPLIHNPIFTVKPMKVANLFVA